MFRKYIAQDKLKTDTKENIFVSQIDYAWKVGIFNNGKTEGLYSDEIKKMANNYLKSANSDLSANVDEKLMWSTLKNYLNNKIEPVSIILDGEELDGKQIRHAVLATDCYTLKVKFKMKNFLGITTTFSENYNIVRICDGWKNTDYKNFEETTYRYVYVDCISELIKLN